MRFRDCISCHGEGDLLRVFPTSATQITWLTLGTLHLEVVCGRMAFASPGNKMMKKPGMKRMLVFYQLVSLLVC